jgi:zinc and cadmium transporter
MADYLDVLFFSLIGGVLSLSGALIFISKKSSTDKLVRYATPFAAGAMLAAAFFDLLPEAIHEITGRDATKWALLGFLIFFLLEHFIHWFHHSHRHDDKHGSAGATLIVIGDSVHNFIDGIAIGAAFLISVPTGIVVAIAVAAHEIPQEIGDFGLLLKHGFSKTKVVQINILSALMSTVGALITFWLGVRYQLPIGQLLAITAGLFIYIAASDLIPSIRDEKSKKNKGNIAVFLLIAGVVLVGLTTEYLHQYIEFGEDGHQETTHSVGTDYHDDEDDHDDENDHDDEDDHHDEVDHHDIE